MNARGKTERAELFGFLRFALAYFPAAFVFSNLPFATVVPYLILENFGRRCMGAVGLNFGSATSGQGFDVTSTVNQIVTNLQAVETPWKTQLTALASKDTALSSLGTQIVNLVNRPAEPDRLQRNFGL